MGNRQKSKCLLMILLLFAMMFLHTVYMGKSDNGLSEKTPQHQTELAKQTAVPEEMILNAGLGIRNILGRMTVDSDKELRSLRLIDSCEPLSSQLSVKKREIYLEVFLLLDILINNYFRKQIHIVQAHDGKK